MGGKLSVCLEPKKSYPGKGFCGNRPSKIISYDTNTSLQKIWTNLHYNLAAVTKRKKANPHRVIEQREKVATIRLRVECVQEDRMICKGYFGRFLRHVYRTSSYSSKSTSYHREHWEQSKNTKHWESVERTTYEYTRNPSLGVRDYGAITNSISSITFWSNHTNTLTSEAQQYYYNMNTNIQMNTKGDLHGRRVEFILFIKILLRYVHRMHG